MVETTYQEKNIMKDQIINPIFAGITGEEMEQIRAQKCLREAWYKNNEVIFHEGDYVSTIGIIEEGHVNIESYDLWGNRSILSKFGPGDAFAETYAIVHSPLMVDAVSIGKTKVQLLDIRILTREENRKFSWFYKIQENMFLSSTKKNLALTSRMFCTSSKSVRGRLLTYLSQQSLRSGSIEFDIPFNRQEMADYLNLDRSALSKELGRMRDEGILTYQKNHFRLNEEKMSL